MELAELLEQMIVRFEARNVARLGAFPWASPVPVFGRLSSSTVATLGINPSNREFVGADGHELEGKDRRFHTLTSLGLRRWADAKREHFKQMEELCEQYFCGNPYDTWFRVLDRLLVGTGASYYGLFARACHIDLVPYATERKWSELSAYDKQRLLQAAPDIIGKLLRESNIALLVVNGRSVLEQLKCTTDARLRGKIMPGWTLPRRIGDGVKGYAYTGEVSVYGGVDLGRAIPILGYSHNLQSSFGVTTPVKDAISGWLTRTFQEVTL